MKARVISSLALPAALATAGLLNTAEAAYAAALRSDTLHAPASDQRQGQPMGGDIALISGFQRPCPPMSNLTVSDYSRCCTSTSNLTICDYGHHQDHGDHDHNR